MLNDKPTQFNALRVVGALLFIVGIGALYFFFTKDTTVSTQYGGRVHNIGLLQDRQNGLFLGGLGTVGGLVLLALSGRK